MVWLFQVFDLSGAEQTKDWAVAKYKEVQLKFSKEHSDFFGAKTIYIATRLFDNYFCRLSTYLAWAFFSVYLG